GLPDINTEITSPQNPRFVLHDSQGFEPGSIETFERTKAFLESRSGNNVPVRHRIHVIWYVCHTLLCPSY
ncbi:hypothetical protein B0H13DRAFT_1599025, partial [Mycena leptocephala]